MGYYGKWKPSKTKAREFAKKMEEIDNFCTKKGISSSSSNDSYYFEINGKNYLVSNHAVESRMEWKHDEYGSYLVPKSSAKREKEVIYIHASKTRIIEIYSNLEAGFELDGKWK